MSSFFYYKNQNLPLPVIALSRGSRRKFSRPLGFFTPCDFEWIFRVGSPTLTTEGKIIARFPFGPFDSSNRFSFRTFRRPFSSLPIGAGKIDRKSAFSPQKSVADFLRCLEKFSIRASLPWKKNLSSFLRRRVCARISSGSDRILSTSARITSRHLLRSPQHLRRSPQHLLRFLHLLRSPQHLR